jgi:tetratricopeptide (TPR) repeat protein
MMALHRRRPLGFVIAAFFLLLAPTSSVLPIVTEVAAEHRMYLPLAAVISTIVVGAFVYLHRWRLPPFVGLVTVAVIALALGSVTSARNLDYHDAETLWRDTVIKRPDNARARHNYATVLLAAGRVAEAEQQLREAIRLRPRHAEAHAALGVALCARQQFSEGIRHLQTALAIAPDFAGAHQSVGEAYAAQGEMTRAVAAYERALVLRPDDVMVMNRIGWILATDANDALRDGSRAIELGMRATALTHNRDATSLDTLAAAQAEMNQWPNAVATVAQAIARARADGELAYIPELEERLRLYQQFRSLRSNTPKP